MTAPDLKTDRTTLKRLPARGAHDFETVARVLDEGIYCHLAFVDGDGQPYAIPTAYGRDGRTIYVHGSAASRTLRTLSEGVPVCLTVTLLDGLIFARSAFHNSVNYRSAMVLGVAQLVEGDERMHGLRAIVEHTMPGRWDDTRWPNERELKQTAVLRVSIDEASAKLRPGGPVDEPEDMELPHWAGQLPLSVVPGTPVPDAHVPDGVPVPDYIASYRRPGADA